MSIDEFLRTPHPFFSGMNPRHLETLARSAMPTRFAAGHVIFREGDAADRFYLIQRGSVSLETHAAGRAVKVQSVGDGEPLGWSWIFPPYHWHFDARTEADTDALYFHSAALREECEANPALGYEVMKRVSEIVVRRLQAARQKLVQHSRPDRAEPRPL
jgi:CRP/FNR family transcriptional regulator, cyclic AMP receptor protein